MKCFWGRTADNRNRKITLLLLMIFCLSLISAFIVGISGNWTGIAMCYVSSSALILAFVYRWRKVWKFLILLGASVVSFFVFVLLHNVFYGLGIMASGIIVLHHLLEVLHVVSFLIAIFVCPAGLLIGAVGSLLATIVYFRKKKAAVEDYGKRI